MRARNPRASSPKNERKYAPPSAITSNPLGLPVLPVSTLNRLWRTSANGNSRKYRRHPKVCAPYILAFPHLSMLVPQFGQVHPPERNSLRLADFLRCSCSRPQLGQVTFRSNPLPATTSQTEFKLRPHFPDLPAVSVAILSKTPASTTVIIKTKRNAMLSILETCDTFA
jgi:hypothetical protein